MGPKKVSKSESDSTAVEASARMAPPPTTAPGPSVACGRTQKILDELLKDARAKVPGVLYEDSFYKASDPTLNPDTAELIAEFGTDVKDRHHRCSTCGCTIGQHPEGRPSGEAFNEPEVVGVAADNVIEKFDEATLFSGATKDDVKVVTIPSTKSFFDNRDHPRIVRVWYRKVWEAVREQIALKPCDQEAGIEITGQPGIGMTNLLDLLLGLAFNHSPNLTIVTIALKKCAVVFVDGSGVRKVVAVDSAASLLTVPALMPPEDKWRTTRILVLHDIKSSGPDSFGYQLMVIDRLRSRFAVTCVVASSPRLSNTHMFRKEFSRDLWLLHMPMLTFNEVSSFLRQTTKHSINEISALYHDFGGVLRHICGLERSQDVAREALESAVKLVRYDPEVVVATDDVTHKVVMHFIDDNMKPTHIFAFVSALARERWFASQGSTEVARVLNSLQRLCKGDNTRGQYGDAFETFSLKQLEQPKTQVGLRRLIRGGEPGPLALYTMPEKVDVCPFPGNVIPNNLLADQKPRLYRPQFHDFPLFDAILVWNEFDATTKAPTSKAVMFQSTVAETHPPPPTKTDVILKSLADSGIEVVGYVFLVDEHSKLREPQLLVSKDTPPPAFNTIPQYVCVMTPNKTVTVRNGASGAKMKIPDCVDDEAVEAAGSRHLALVRKYSEADATTTRLVGNVIQFDSATPAPPAMPWPPMK